MRRRRSTRGRKGFKSPKHFAKKNKGIYIIIVLVCMIGLNIGSIAIKFSKNVKANNESQTEIASKKSNSSKVKNIFKGFFDKGDRKNQEEPMEEHADGYENSEDFIVIEDLEEYENFIVVKDSSGGFNLEDIPEPVNVKKVKVDKTKPYILAFHTHSNEAFQPLKRGVNYSSDSKQNMLSIGDIVSKVLETGNHNIIYNKTQHDIPSFNKSYSRSLNTIKTEMAKEKNIKFLFDIHRDGREIKAKSDKEYFDKMEEYAKTFRTTIDGKQVAKFSLVVGPDSANFQQNLSYAKYIKAVSDTIYPGLCKGIIIKPYGRFNQHLSDYSALVEVGANVSTIEESKETAKLLGEILNLVISKIIL